MTTGPRIIRYHPRAAVGDGGMTGAIRHWSEALASLGAEITIAYADGQAPATSDSVTWMRVQHRGVGSMRLPVGVEGLVRSSDLVVLHSGWTAHNARFAAVARSLGVPYILEPRGAYDPHIVARHGLRKRAWWLAAEGRVVRGATAIHAFFETERSHLEAIGYRGPVVIAPNGVEVPHPIRWKGGGGYLLWAGRFDSEHKGLDLLVDAVGRLAPGERPRVRLHGPDWRGGRARVAAMVERRGLGRWIRLGPAVYGAEKAALLIQSDGFLYPSRWDACPNAVLEAVAFGVPTLCTPYPLGAHLGRRGAVVLAEPSADGLAAGLTELSDRSRASMLSAAGVETCARDFRWDSVAQRWLEQVTQLVGRRGTADSRPADRAPMSDTART